MGRSPAVASHTKVTVDPSITGPGGLTLAVTTGTTEEGVVQFQYTPDIVNVMTYLQVQW